MLPKQPNFDYFYGIEADQFTFYRIPKELFTNTYFKGLSAEAKILYGLMLDRMSLSRKNSWLDNENRVYIIFKNEEVKEQLSCGNDKASKLFAELEKYNLIIRKKRGQGHPSLIYVKNIYSSVNNDNEIPDEDCFSDAENKNEQVTNQDCNAELVASQNDYVDYMGEYYDFKTSENQNSRLPESGIQEIRKSEFKTSENQNSRNPKIGIQDFRKSESNNTNISNIDYSNTDSNNSSSVEDVAVYYRSITGLPVSKNKQDIIKCWLSEIPAELVIRAISVADKRNIKAENIFIYVDSIIRDYIKNGLYTLEQVEAAESQYKLSYAKDSASVGVDRIKPKGPFNNYNQKIYSADEIDEILKRKAQKQQVFGV